MLVDIVKQIKSALVLFVLLSILTGLIYPALVTGLGQLLFPWQANGSLIKQNNKVIGSKLIGQYFNDPKYFWGRPSATKPFPYNAENSSGSNLGVSSPRFLSTVKYRVENFYRVSFQDYHSIPGDLVMASGSGLDPEISPEAAFYQVPRIAKLREMPEKSIQDLVYRAIENRTFCILGEPRVNVLQLNLALDSVSLK